MENKQIWLAIRDAFLGIIDAIERQFDIQPRTADLRKLAKRANMKQYSANINLGIPKTGGRFVPEMVRAASFFNPPDGQGANRMSTEPKEPKQDVEPKDPGTEPGAPKPEPKPVVEEEPKPELSDEQKALVQAEIDRLLPKRADQATRAKLKELGVDSEEELKTALKELEERKTAELTEVQKLEKERDDLKTALDQKDTEAKRSRFEAAVVSAASKLNFADPQDAVRYIEDNAEDVAEAVKALAEEKPYLLNTDKSRPPGLNPNKPPSGGQVTETREEKLKRLGLR